MTPGRSGALLLLLTLAAGAAGAQETSDRQLMYQLLQRMDQLEREMRQLRGEQEVLQYQLQQAEDRAQKRYADTNNRLGRLEGGAGAGTALPPAAGGPALPGDGTGGVGLPSGGELIGPGGAPPGLGDPAPTPGAPAASLAGEQAAYEQAFALLREGAFAEAVDGFESFLDRYPSGDLAANAQYWLGEAHYVNRDFEEAKAAFEEVMARYPGSAKGPDAHLKLGFTLQELGQTAGARSTLQEVVKSYPGSPVARLAERRLQELGG